jgi:hypothetical protein
LRTEKFILTAILLQFLFYVAAYVITPNDVQWHIVNSWVRILDHIAVLLGFTALLVTGRFFATPSGILWTVVGDGGTNSGSSNEKSGTERPDGAQPREDRRKGPPEGPGELPQDH